MATDLSEPEGVVMEAQIIPQQFVIVLQAPAGRDRDARKRVRKGKSDGRTHAEFQIGTLLHAAIELPTVLEFEGDEAVRGDAPVLGHAEIQLFNRVIAAIRTAVRLETRRDAKA